MSGKCTQGAAIRRALTLITEAMDLLDAHDGPPDAAAHLDLAQDRIRKFLASKGGAGD